MLRSATRSAITSYAARPDSPAPGLSKKVVVDPDAFPVTRNSSLAALHVRAWRQSQRGRCRRIRRRETSEQSLDPKVVLSHRICSGSISPVQRAPLAKWSSGQIRSVRFPEAPRPSLGSSLGLGYAAIRRRDPRGQGNVAARGYVYSVRRPISSFQIQSPAQVGTFIAGRG
jgi:hypothetical protein